MGAPNFALIFDRAHRHLATVQELAGPANPVQRARPDDRSRC